MYYINSLDKQIKMILNFRNNNLWNFFQKSLRSTINMMDR